MGSLAKTLACGLLRGAQLCLIIELRARVKRAPRASKKVPMDKKFFFDRYGLAQADIERYLAGALSAGGNFADLYFEYQVSTSVSLHESMVKSATQGISVGCGVRVLSGERTGYAYTDDLAPERILHAAKTAARLARGPAKDRKSVV